MYYYYSVNYFEHKLIINRNIDKNISVHKIQKPNRPSMTTVSSGGAMLQREEENEADVRREDQDKINEFASLNARLHEIRDEAESLKVRRTSNDVSGYVFFRVDPSHSHRPSTGLLFTEKVTRH